MNQLYSVRLLIIAILCVTATACQQARRDVFPTQAESLVWPAPPAQARIRYIGQLASSANLHAPAKPLQGLTDLLFGAKAPQSLYGPRALVTSPDGQRVWIADPGGRCIHGFDLKSRKYRKVTHAGTAPLIAPVGISRGPDASIWVCDSAGVAIHRFSDDDGRWIETLRIPEDVHRPVASFWHDERDELYVVDTIDHNIKVLDSSGRLRRVLGTRGTRPGYFNFPSDLASDGRTLWVVDTGNHRIQALSLAGDPILEFGRAGTGMGDLAMPKSIALDSEGHLYVIDARFENVQVFAPGGALLLYFGEEGVGRGEFWLPSGIHIDSANRIWVCDTYNQRVQVFQYLPGTTDRPDGRPALTENRK